MPFVAIETARPRNVSGVYAYEIDIEKLNARRSSIPSLVDRMYRASSHVRKGQA
jgi:hypothetical protein